MTTYKSPCLLIFGVNEVVIVRKLRDGLVVNCGVCEVRFFSQLRKESDRPSKFESCLEFVKKTMKRVLGPRAGVLGGPFAVDAWCPWGCQHGAVSRRFASKAMEMLMTRQHVDADRQESHWYNVQTR